MSDGCLVCGRDISGCEYCSYCGHMVVRDTDGSGYAQEDADTYKKNLLSNLTRFGIDIYQYNIISQGSIPQLVADGTKRANLGDAEKCYQNIVWLDSKGSLAKHDSSASGCDVVVHYRNGKKQRQVKLAVPLIKTNDFWNFGIMIDERLSLRAYIGSAEEHSESEPVDLVFS